MEIHGVHDALEKLPEIKKAAKLKIGDIYRFDTVEEFLDVMTGDLDVEELGRHRLTSNSNFPEVSPVLE